MPNKKSAEKRVQVSERNRVANRDYRSAVRTAIKKALSLTEAANAPKDQVQDAVKTAQSLIDRAVLKGIFKKNKGSRDKSRLFRAAERQSAS